MPEPCLNYVLCVFLVLASSSNHPLRRIRTSTIEQVFLNLKGNRPLFRVFAEDGGAFWRALARTGAHWWQMWERSQDYPELSVQPARRKSQVHTEEYADARDLDIELFVLLSG